MISLRDIAETVQKFTTELQKITSTNIGPRAFICEVMPPESDNDTIPFNEGDSISFIVSVCRIYEEYMDRYPSFSFTLVFYHTGRLKIEYAPKDIGYPTLLKDVENLCLQILTDYYEKHYIWEDGGILFKHKEEIRDDLIQKDQ